MLYRLSGVQIGGRRSPRGIVGVWTGADREIDDALTPCGPFCYWFIGNEEDDKAHIATIVRRNVEMGLPEGGPDGDEEHEEDEDFEFEDEFDEEEMDEVAEDEVDEDEEMADEDEVVVDANESA